MGAVMGVRVRWRRVLIALPTAFVLAFAGLFALWLHGVPIPGASGASWFRVVRSNGADFTPAPGGPVFLLVVGSDAREGVDGARGDALHLIGVNPTLHQATILDIPRDTGAQIPGHGLDKINAANQEGGPALQAATVGQLVGVKIPYTIETDFDGFVRMVDGLGGLQVTVPEPMHDTMTGADFPAGPQRLNGAQALAYSRNRHQFATGDIRRTENQGFLIVSALAQLRAQNTGPLGTIRLLGLLGRHTRLEGVGLRDLYDLGRLGLSIDPANVRNVVIPVTSGSGTRLALGAGAQELFADFADDAVLQQH